MAAKLVLNSNKRLFSMRLEGYLCVDLKQLVKNNRPLQS